jgi:hypothetical protein
MVPGALSPARRTVDRTDLAVIAGLYVAVVVLFRLEFGYFTVASVAGLFEAIFFRGFVLPRLEASFGPVVAVAGAALLYALYHVGYGMGAVEMTFLFGLGVVYAIPFRIVGNLLVIWPQLTGPVEVFPSADGAATNDDQPIAFRSTTLGDVMLHAQSNAGTAPRGLSRVGRDWELHVADGDRLRVDVVIDAARSEFTAATLAGRSRLSLPIT